MAQKKIPSIDDAVKIFKDVTRRASLSDYIYVNNSLISTNPKGNSIIIVPDQTLWSHIIDDPELKDHLKELDVTNPEEYEKSKLLQYASDFSNDSWVEADSDALFSGKLLNIDVDGFEYKISINKGLIPLKLRKAEYNSISYRVFPDSVLSLKKQFDFAPIENCGFAMIRMFQMI